MSIQKLKLLMKNLEEIPNCLTYKAVILLSYLDSLDWHH